MYTINAIFEDVVTSNCSNVYIKLFDNTDNMIFTGYIKTADIMSVLEDKSFHMHSVFGSKRIQMDTIFTIQNYVGEEFFKLIKSQK